MSRHPFLPSRTLALFAAVSVGLAVSDWLLGYPRWVAALMAATALGFALLAHVDARTVRRERARARHQRRHVYYPQSAVRVLPRVTHAETAGNVLLYEPRFSVAAEPPVAEVGQP